MAKASYVWSGSEWVPVASAFPAAHQRSIVDTASTSYVLGNSDTGKAVVLTNSNPITVTIPADSTYTFPIGQTMLVVQNGTGTVTIEGAVGVTVNGTGVSGSVDITGQYGVATLLKINSDSWIIFGNVA